MKPAPYTLNNLLAALDAISPFALAQAWDNVGLMVGDPAQEVSGVLAGLDPTEALLDEALAAGLNTIITHHPLLFRPLKTVRTDQPLGRFLGKALRNNIAVVACHTNLDISPDGVNDILAARLDLRDTRPLAAATAPNEPNRHDSPAPGFGRIGSLAPPLSGREFVKKTMAVLNAPALFVAGQPPERITTVAVCGGSGSDLAEQAFLAGASVYVTGEVKHSVARWAEMAGMCIIDAGHFATENLVIPEFVAALEALFTRDGLPVPVMAARRQRSPFTLFCQTQSQETLYEE